MYTFTLSLTYALYGVGDQRHATAFLLPGKGAGEHCTGGWPVCTCVENLTPAGIQSLNRPSQSLYGLRYQKGELRLS
jgi:hypothetical protein